jgi:hypothetical protein
MPHIPFDSKTVTYGDYHHMVGSGLDDDTLSHYYHGAMPFQRGYGRQRGAGIGDVLRGVWRMLLPIIRRAGTTVAQEAVATGGRVVEKIGQGEKVRESLVNESKRGMDNLLEKTGLPKQFGTGRGIKRRRPRKRVSFAARALSLPSAAIQPAINQPRQRKRQDTFGLY